MSFAFHAAPPPGEWCNDPNGLVYADGAWRLFVQDSATAPDFGKIGWARLSSTDLPFRDRVTQRPRFLPSIRERDGGQRAEAQLSALVAAPLEHEDPRLRAKLADVKVEPLAVVVTARLVECGSDRATSRLIF